MKKGLLAYISSFEKKKKIFKKCSNLAWLLAACPSVLEKQCVISWCMNKRKSPWSRCCLLIFTVACDIKAFFPTPLWCTSKKKIFWRNFKLWLFPSQHFHLDLLEANNCFICNLRKRRFHITAQQTPEGGEKQRQIFWKNASSDVLQMTASQSVIQSVNQGVCWGGAAPGASCLNACAHYILWCMMFWNAKYISAVPPWGQC